MFRIVTNSGFYIRFLRDANGTVDYTAPIVDHRPSKATRFRSEAQASEAVRIMAEKSLPFLGYHGPVKVEQFKPLGLRIALTAIDVLLGRR